MFPICASAKMYLHRGLSCWILFGLLLYSVNGTCPVEKRSGRIIRGQNASISNHPFMLMIRKDGKTICTANVIASKHALSAAHCFNPVPSLQRITLHGGSTTQTGVAVVFNVSQIDIHPMYDEINSEYDIAVLKITKRFNGFPNIASIALQKTDIPISSTCPTICYTTGWGYTSTEIISSTLQYGSLRLVQQKTCENQWSPVPITANKICAQNETTVVCAGDSGGPLVCEGRLYGIVSFGQTECEGTLPIVYTKITATPIRAFIQFIAGI